MDKPGYTPGPWIVKRKGPMVWVESPVHTVCSFYRENVGYAPSVSMHSEANARLIAAAPEMFEALQDIINAIDTGNVEMNSPEIGGHDDIPLHPWHEQWIYRARAALSKATGEPSTGGKEGGDV